MEKKKVEEIERRICAMLACYFIAGFSSSCTFYVREDLLLSTVCLVIALLFIMLIPAIYYPMKRGLIEEDQ